MAVLSRSAAASPCCAIAGKCRWRSTFAIRRGGVAVFLLTCAMAMGNLADLRTQNPPPGEYEVKAAFLYNFAKFVEWPQGAFADADSPLIIGVLGEDPFGEVLDRTVAGKLAQGRPLRIQRWKRLTEIRRCHILFVSTSERGALPELLETFQAAAVLTVSESDKFAERGGIVHFLLIGSKVRFEINDVSAKKAGLKISSRLLALATTIWE